MAGADYYCCDKCDKKTFYDADLSYGEWDEMRTNPKTGHAWPDGNVGDMAVLCKECAEKHEIIIKKK
jgi:hypothetical protein